jgi:hypothetical protein
VTDPTTALIEAQNNERTQLRTENQVDRLRDEAFVAGYDQAVREIRDHFAKAGDHGTVHVIETTWLGKPTAFPPKPRML